MFTLMRYPLWYNYIVDLMSIIVTVALIGGFVFIARSWGKGGDDDNSCNT